MMEKEAPLSDVEHNLFACKTNSLVDFLFYIFLSDGQTKIGPIYFIL